ncbi:MAG: hypothetical protein ACK6CT_00980 [Planctomycetia bacterium]|jgi:hypothetical protein
MPGHRSGGESTRSVHPATAGAAAALLVLCLIAMLAAAQPPAGRRPPVAPRSPAAASARPQPDAEERQRKARLLAGGRWRRAVFEFDEWLATQPVYTPAEVRRIKADLAARVAEMSSYEIEYLLDALEAKLTILDSSRAREARDWLGRYLAVMAAWRRADLLEHVPNLLDMTAGELSAAVEAVEAKRRAVEQMARASQRSRRELAAFTAAERDREAAARAALGRIRRGDVAFSPYRGQPVGELPFAGAYDSPTVVGTGAWLTPLGINIGGL